MTDFPQTATVKFDTHIDLKEGVRDQMIAVLNQSLADVFDLYSQTKQAHWNVKGLHFQQLHELFDTIAADLPEFADMLAERVTALGGYATGTVRMAATNSSLPAFPENLPDVLYGEAIVKAMVERWALYAASVREGIDLADEAGDKDTADLFTEISRTIDKHLWFLEAHIQ